MLAVAICSTRRLPQRSRPSTSLHECRAEYLPPLRPVLPHAGFYLGLESLQIGCFLCFPLVPVPIVLETRCRELLFKLVAKAETGGLPTEPFTFGLRLVSFQSRVLRLQPPYKNGLGWTVNDSSATLGASTAGVYALS